MEPIIVQGMFSNMVQETTKRMMLSSLDSIIEALVEASWTDEDRVEMCNDILEQHLGTNRNNLLTNWNIEKGNNII